VNIWIWLGFSPVITGILLPALMFTFSSKRNTFAKAALKPFLKVLLVQLLGLPHVTVVF
jgi:hypothetical protein